MSGPVPGTPTPWVGHSSKDSPDFWSISRVEPYDDIAYFTLHSQKVKAADVAAIVHRVNNWDALEAERDALKARVDALVEAVKTADAAIKEMFRYFDGGETRGSYDGKPERNQLRKAGYVTSAALSLAKGEQP